MKKSFITAMAGLSAMLSANTASAEIMATTPHSEAHMQEVDFVACAADNTIVHVKGFFETTEQVEQSKQAFDRIFTDVAARFTSQQYGVPVPKGTPNREGLDALLNELGNANMLGDETHPVQLRFLMPVTATGIACPA